MKLYVLSENMSIDSFKAEFGLSYLIEYENKKILFDTGHSEIFIKNAELLHIDLDKIKTIVLSHGHWDHGNGLKYLDNKELICHPQVFTKRYKKNDGSYVGLNSSYDELKKKFMVKQTRQPYFLSKNIIFLGEIPRLFPFESQTTAFIDNNRNDDFIPDDSALAIIKGNELIVVSGCAHAGICNIIEYAKKISSLKKLKAVIGGFHLKKNNLQTKETIKYFKQQNITHILPAHCTALPVLSAFYREFKIKQVKAGMVFSF